MMETVSPLIVNVVDGELADGGYLLGVEDQQEPGDAVLCRQRGVAQQAPGVGPALLAVVGLGGPIQRTVP